MKGNDNAIALPAISTFILANSMRYWSAHERDSVQRKVKSFTIAEQERKLAIARQRFAGHDVGRLNKWSLELNR